MSRTEDTEAVDRPRSWTRLRSRLLVDRPPWIRVFEDDVELPDGRLIPGYLRVESRAYAMAFAVTEKQRVVCLRGYKYGIDQWDLQLPAGYLEEGESPLACVRRELLEETGFVAETWESLGSLCADGNRGFGWGHFFLARNARQVTPPESGDLEEARVELVPLEAATSTLLLGDARQLGPVACAGMALARLAIAFR